jgi:hypothetical protein
VRWDKHRVIAFESQILGKDAGWSLNSVGVP